jgi:aromatic ring hydroxylase
MKLDDLSPNRCVAFYMMSSYLYYEKDKQVLTDGMFDQMCKKILKTWDQIDHPHKKLIDKESLEAGTGYYIKYTNMIKGAAESWYAENQRLKKMTPRQKASLGQSSLENFFQ